MAELKADPAITTAAELVTPEPELPAFAEKIAAPTDRPYIPDEDLPAFPHHAENKTARPFIGGIARGRGRLVTADDSSFAIEANPPLTASEHALAVKHGFDDESPDGSLLIADKRAMREVNGDINWVARAVTGKDWGRER